MRINCWDNFIIIDNLAKFMCMLPNMYKFHPKEHFQLHWWYGDIGIGYIFNCENSNNPEGYMRMCLKWFENEKSNKSRVYKVKTFCKIRRQMYLVAYSLAEVAKVINRVRYPF